MAIVSKTRPSEPTFSPWQGLTRQQVQRHNCLFRLGLTEADVNYGQRLFELQHLGSEKTPSKIHQLTGYNKHQMARAKALRVLGTSEEELAESIAWQLGSLGQPDPLLINTNNDNNDNNDSETPLDAAFEHDPTTMPCSKKLRTKLAKLFRRKICLAEGVVVSSNQI